jgi:hypothetical protein
MRIRRTHIVIPRQAAERELKRLRQCKALAAATGSWRDKDHPDLKQGAAKWVDRLRGQDESRFQEMTTRASTPKNA